MEHLVKLLRDSYDLQEEKSEETAYWHLQELRSEIKQLALTDVSIMLPSPDKLYKMAETIVDRQKRIIDLPNKESIDWEDLKNDWFDWLDDEIKGN